MTVPSLVRVAAEKFGSSIAVRDGATEITYGELAAAADRFAGALAQSGIRKGDRVAIWAFNSWEWVVSLLGLMQAGAALVPINTRFKGPEAAQILSRSRAKALITVADFLGTNYLEMLEDSGTALPGLEIVIVARGDTTEQGGSWPATSWTDFVRSAGTDALEDASSRGGQVTPEDVSDILFTSGTTGVPKGVVMTHSRTVRVATDWVDMTGLCVEDRYLMVNPYFHMFGLKAGILACVASGATMLPESVFDVARVLDRIEAERVTVLPGPPTLYQSLLDHPDRLTRDLSSLRVAVTGAADIPVELIRRVREELPFSLLITGYGLTEAGTVTGTSPQDDFVTVATTVGRSRPGFQLRIVDQSGSSVPCGEAGEVIVRGDSVMSHYLDDAEATAAVLTDDGWLRTGDLGVMDPSGNLRIVGRIKDMFIVGGFNVYPAEVENALLRHPGVAAAAVIGVPDRRLGEVGVAFVVSRADPQAQPDEIIEWCRDQMANYKVPRRVEVVDELPLNATGKVQKDLLRQKVALA